MSSYNFRCVQQSFMQHADLPFADTLTEDTIQQAFDDEGVAFAQGEDDVYTPAMTLWAFLSQVLFKDGLRSCKAAVARVVVLLTTLGREPCAGNTGAYCRARAKIPVVILRRLTLQVADECERQVPEAWLWKGRHVHLVDGTTVSMPDTQANQAEYPQPKSQKPGLGFPITRLVVLLSLSTAMVTGMALGRYKGKITGEPALLRQLLERFQPGDVLLGDRYYCSYFMIALLQELGIDFVARLHQRRKADTSRDQVVEWRRPKKPEWMDAETYQRMPASLRVREVPVQVRQKGFRVTSLVVATTLLDANEHSRDDVAELYHQRWLAELDIRSIKITLGMDVLRCKTPEMVRREIWACLLAHNLIRKTMLQSAFLAQRSPRQISFTAALQKIAASWTELVTCTASTRVRLIEVHLYDLAKHEVGNRPDRVEPRAKKRRPKPHRLMTKPRQQAQAELLGEAAN